MKIRNKFALGALFSPALFPSAYLPRSDIAKKYDIIEEDYFDEPADEWRFENLAFIQIIKSFHFVQKYNHYVREHYTSR